MSEEIVQQQTPIPEAESGVSEFGRFVWELVKVFVISMIIVLLVRYFIAQPFIVSGSSMEPNFYNGQYLVINEIGYTFGAPQRGDIIVFKYPKDTSQYFIKRIIGLPGERVDIQDNKVIVFNSAHPNGFALDESYLPKTDLTFADGQFNNVTVGNSEYFVLGDNRMASSDSRFWGTVPKNDIVGKVWLRAFPFQSFKEFGSITYPQN